MLTRLSVGVVILVLAGMGAVTAYQYRGMSTSISTLTHRIIDLGDQNLLLQKQLDWMEQQLENEKRRASADSAKTARHLAKLIKMIEDAALPGRVDSGAQYAGMDFAPARNMSEKNLDDDNFITEVTTTPPADAQTTPAKITPEEGDNRRRENLIRNLDSFAEKNQIDKETEEYIAGLLDESVGGIAALRDSVDSNALHWREFALESQRIQEEMDSKLSSVLSEEQMAAFRAGVLQGP